MNPRLITIGCVGLLACGCARAKMQASAAQVADAVVELREDVEAQQLIRTELARTSVERLARSEAELATQEARRTAERARVDPSVEPLLRHSRAVSEAADPRFAPNIASELERRETAAGYRDHVDDLQSLSTLLMQLSTGLIRQEVELYLELGAAAAEAAKAEWTQAQE